ncbi:34441_t:CDS:1, partial [Racocetra persica]
MNEHNITRNGRRKKVDKLNTADVKYRLELRKSKIIRIYIAPKIKLA